MRGKEQDTLSEVTAGDIGAVAKLSDTATGDTLAPKGTPVVVSTIQAPEPALSIASRPRSKGDEDKLPIGLHRLQDEDPALRVERNDETQQTLLAGNGRDPPRRSSLERLARKFGVEVNTEEVRVPYRETITARGRGGGQVQEADRWPRPVRRRIPPGGAARPRGRLRVRRQDRRRRDPPPVHPRGREGHRRGDGRPAVSSASPSSTSASRASTASTTRSTRRR